MLLNIWFKAYRCVIYTLSKAQNNRIDETYNACSEVKERLFFLLLFTDKLNNESVVFPVDTTCLLQSQCASQRPIKAIDLFHTFNPTRVTLRNRFILFPSLRSAHTPLPPSPSVLTLRLPSFIQTCSAVAELHIERRRGLTSWSCESHLNRCSSWADTQVSPCESMLLIQRESGSQQWCDKLRFLIFHSADLFLLSTALPPINTQLPPSTLLSHSPILFPISCYPLERKAYSNGNEEG